jgi:hypothetical protein
MAQNPRSPVDRKKRRKMLTTVYCLTIKRGTICIKNCLIITFSMCFTCIFEEIFLIVSSLNNVFRAFVAQLKEKREVEEG